MDRLKNKYQFCFIAPTKYIETIINFSKTHLTLAHIAAKDKQYVSYYKQASKKGDFIILDNGAFELGESYTPDKLIPIAKEIGATAVVLPDYPGQHVGKTIEKAEQYIPIFRDEGLKTFFVPQGEIGELDQWVEGYQWAIENPDIDIIGMSILGIPNALANYCTKEVSRLVMLGILKDRGLLYHSKHHHFLGLNSGPGLEIPSFKKLLPQFTIDSSGPVWAGIHNVKYDKRFLSLMSITKDLLPPVDFDYEFLEQTTAVINHNCNVVNQMLEEKDD